jgi:hypothetical protein
MNEMGERILRRMIEGCPEIASMFAAQPAYRYWEVGQRRFCYNTEPISGDHPWTAFEYAPTGPGSRTGKASELKLVRTVNCATRKAAKARAYRWYETAKAKE